MSLAVTNPIQGSQRLLGPVVLNRWSPLHQGLVAYYSIRPGFGGVKDLLWGPNGTLTGNDMFTSNPVAGHGVKFDGTSGGVSVAGANRLNGLIDLTVSTWFVRPSGGIQFPMLVQKSDPVTSNNQTRRWQVTLNTTSNFLLFIAGYSTAGGIWRTTNADVLLTNILHNFTVVYTHADTAQDPTLYVDGRSRAVTESTTPLGTAADDDDALFIGDNDDDTLEFNGSIYLVAIWNRRLSAAEAWRLYDPATRWELEEESHFPVLTGTLDITVPSIAPPKKLISVSIG